MTMLKYSSKIFVIISTWPFSVIKKDLCTFVCTFVPLHTSGSSGVVITYLLFTCRSLPLLLYVVVCVWCVGGMGAREGRRGWWPLEKQALYWGFTCFEEMKDKITEYGL